MTCLHCGHKWISEIIPKKCSKCYSPNWKQTPRYYGNTREANKRFIPNRLSSTKTRYYAFKAEDLDEQRRLDIIRAMYPPRPGQRIACLYYPDLEGRTLYVREGDRT